MTSVLKNKNDCLAYPAKIITSKKNRVKVSNTYESGCHPVEKIIGFYSGKEKSKYYRVQWMPSWIPEENLVGCEKLIEQFFVEENIINKDAKDVNGNIFNKTEIKLEEEDYSCWGIERKPVYVKVCDDEDSSDNEPLIKKKLKIKNGAGANNLLSSDNEPIVKEKLINQNGADENNLPANKDVNNDVVQENVVESKEKHDESISPRTSNKSATRAMMVTNSPTFVKSPVQSPINVEKTIKVEDVDPDDQGSKVNRKYQTRQFLKESRYNLRKNRELKKFSTRSRKTSGQDNDGDSTIKVYITRLHVKQLTTNRKRTGKGVVNLSQGVKKSPFAYSNSDRKSSSPQQKYGNKDKKILNADDCNYVDTVERSSNDSNDVSTEERKFDDNAVSPIQRNSTVTSIQNNIDTDEQHSSYGEQNTVRPVQRTVIKQEPVSPESFNPLCPQLRTSNKKEPYECSDKDDSARKMNEYIKEELVRYKNYSPLIQRNCIKDEPLHFSDIIDVLKDGSSGCDSKLKSRTNSYNSSSDESEAIVESPFECDVCEKMFQTSVLLHRHRFIHCEDRPFTFDKRRDNRLCKENKENCDLRKLEVRSNSSESDCQIVHSHHLRPRRDVKGIR